MPTQKYIVDGKRVPGTTTIISRFKESGGLVHWSWQCGIDGIDYRKVRDDAANAGTLAHAMVEATIRGKEFPTPNDYPLDTWEKAQSAYSAFDEWTKQTKLKPLETEVALTCRCHMFGGTLDAMLIQDQLALGDWKTGNAIYSDYLLQLAAYGHLWTVNYPDRPITGGYHLLRFSKEHGDFSHHYWRNLDRAWRQFELFREAYDLDKEIKARL